MESLVLNTVYISLVAQILTGAYGVYGLTLKVPPRKQLLKTSLKFEMFVQFIELLFYFWLVNSFNLATMAKTRYKDWFFTTPLMLVSAMLYYYHEKLIEEKENTENILSDFFEEYGSTVAVVLTANFFMILFGYLGESGRLSLYKSAFFGFIAFFIAFYTLWSQLASKSKAGRQLFTVIAIVWTLYGFAYLLPVAQKNISYNFLDVIAKNFFGVYLAYKVSQASKLS